MKKLFLLFITFIISSCGFITSNPIYRSKLPKYYFVKKGDTLNKISKEFGVSVNAIKKYNNITSDTIAVGRKLYLKMPRNNFTYYIKRRPIPKSGYHIVKKGETLPMIAVKYNIPLQKLMDYNNFTSYKIKVGWKIILTDRFENISSHPKNLSKKTSSKKVKTTKQNKRKKVKIPNDKNYVLPLKGIVTSEFGMRHGRPHKGIDIAAPIGTPIRSVADGKVVFAGVQNGYGNVVIIEHKNNIMTVYAHCHKILVRVNDMVKKGQQIATVGKTGRATGPHLHFEFRIKEKAINPRKIFNF